MHSQQNEHAASSSAVTQDTYPCLKCGKSFSKAVNLKRHMHMHKAGREDSKKKCPIDGCSYSAYRQERVNDHIASVHYHSKRHVCNVAGCGFATASQGAFTRHIKSNHGYIPPIYPKRRPTYTAEPPRRHSSVPLAIRSSEEAHHSSNEPKTSPITTIPLPFCLEHQSSPGSISHISSRLTPPRRDPSERQPKKSLGEIQLPAIRKQARCGRQVTSYDSPVLNHSSLERPLSENFVSPAASTSALVPTDSELWHSAGLGQYFDYSGAADYMTTPAPTSQTIQASATSGAVSEYSSVTLPQDDDAFLALLNLSHSGPLEFM